MRVKPIDQKHGAFGRWAAADTTGPDVAPKRRRRRSPRATATSTVGSATNVPAMDAPSTSGQANRASLFAALQGKITVLKQEIIAAEQSLDQVQPEDIPQLKTALLQVSKMISQMEAAADYLNVQRLNMKNEIRTYQDENIHLQGALIRERRKSQGKDRGSAFSPRWGRGIPPPPPPPPKRENVVYNSMRSYIFPPTATRPLNEDESSVIDLTFDGAGSSASSARTASNAASNPGTSGVRRLRGSAR
ncbi:hypothetical protein HPB47_012600 [Ixodes persulcatus]|uniref:Uncharacterized protein n=1 Tax=Ixodes persulcatus TaxID=34615 RepID=A0AC60NT19_IXOPE|nr:hypothetical protein HPB47_012600 [Ixodes persulcatus]